MKNKKTGNRKVIIWSLIGVLVLASAIALYLRPKKIDYTEFRPTIGNLTTNYSFSGSVEAKNRQTVFADKAMQIKEIKVKEEEEVTNDLVLMTTVGGGEIKSKIAGEVSGIYAEENAQLMPGAKLIDIVDYTDLQLKVQVDEYDLSAVSKDKDAIVTIHSLKKDISGKIKDVSKEGEYANGVTNFTATISLAKDNNLRTGMSAEAKVINQSVTNAVLMPMSAIQFDAQNTPYVLIKDSNNLPKTVELTLGINDGVLAEIKSGVTANDIVLVPPTAKAADFGPGAQMGQDRDESTKGGVEGGMGQ
ncbi:efflux RND transporter periplasmic adaptor subunit [Desulfosporosinus shakirovi]|uniref:efflux RND transporter periplasmic adaptor subunit n=1 Tax=Desulfosporosinus shakirovi TaxID=2885154 RepID=UPI001E564730|nr:HlyD family efflux transporter periplasmic adaptor subunit [Desulfosporosinus sp. SRJS8]MCB8815184.1 efflux RND transporter periplasmic adaptor subunit [Desulfosporosinus sp. SRJS8]